MDVKESRDQLPTALPPPQVFFVPDDFSQRFSQNFPRVFPYDSPVGQISYTLFMSGCVDLVDDKLDHMLWKASWRMRQDLYCYPRTGGIN